ncbi:MAG: tRNA dimethylallyltransferase, partial [Pseudomonadota bacterium]
RRAVEVMKTQNLTMTELKKQMSLENHSPLPEHKAIKVGLSDERSQLKTRVAARTQKMLAAGFIEEVESLRQKGLSQWAPMESVGYREVQMHLDGEIESHELSERITTATLQLIKKQQTWFKRDYEIQWFLPSAREQALNWVCDQL